MHAKGVSLALCFPTFEFLEILVDRNIVLRLEQGCRSMY